MAFVDDLLRRLEAAKGDTQAQAAVAAEFVLAARPEPEREPLRDALDAAAVLRWFDARLLAALLEIPEEEGRKWLEALEALPFVERYRAQDRDLRNIHESTRLGWRKQLAREAPERFRALCERAAAHFADDLSRSGRIEWVYHRLCGDPDGGATDLEMLDREWSGAARPEDRYALAAALRELEETQLVRGRALAWVLIVTAWTRVSRGEAAQLGDVASEAVRLAQEAGDRRAEADAQGLLGDVLHAQGKLVEAQAAFAECLAISRRLAEQDPSNAGWQQELAVAHGRIGDVLQTQGKLAEAQAVFAERLAISRRLVDQDPSNAGWQQGLAVTHSRIGDVLQAQGKLSEAQAAFAECLAISRRLAEQDPSNAVWQRELAVTHGRIGGVLEAQGKLSEAQAVFAERLAISRRLAEQDPSNAVWQRDLGVAHNRIGDVLQAQGQLAEAQVAFTESLAISRRLTEQDPSNAGWQRELAVAHSRTGDVLQAQGKLAEAQAAFAQFLAISRRLAEQDPSNASWQRDLAVAHNRIGGMLAAQGKLAEARAAFAEHLAITPPPSRAGSQQHELATRSRRDLAEYGQVVVE